MPSRCQVDALVDGSMYDTVPVAIVRVIDNEVGTIAGSILNILR